MGINLAKVLEEREISIERRLNVYQKAASVVAIALTICSCYFSGALFEQFALKGYERAVWWAVAVSLQAAMSILAYMSGYNLYRGTGKAAFPTVMFVFIFMLSMVASLGAMTEATDKRQTSVNATSNQKETVRGEMADLERQIVWTQNQMEALRKESIMTKGYLPAQERLNTLTEKKQQLAAVMMDLESDTKTDGNALFRSLANLFGGNPETIKDYVYFAISFAIDGSSIALMLLAGGLGAAVRDRKKGKPLSFPFKRKQQDSIRSERTAPDFIMGDGENELYEIRTGTLAPETAPETGTLAPETAPETGTSAPKTGTGNREPGPETENLKPESLDLLKKSGSRTSTSTSTGEKPAPETGTLAPEPGPEIGTLKPEPAPETGTSAPEPGTVKPDPDKFGEYKQVMIENIKPDGSTIGRRKIADMIGITQKQADAFHQRLKRAGEVKVEKLKTFPLFGKGVKV